MTDSVLTQQLGPGQRGSRRDCVVQRMVNTGRFPQVVEPRTHLSMGESMEITAKQWQISRQEQDELALASHRNAAKAYAEVVEPLGDCLQVVVEKLRPEIKGSWPRTHV